MTAKPRLPNPEKSNRLLKKMRQALENYLQAKIAYYSYSTTGTIKTLMVDAALYELAELRLRKKQEGIAQEEHDTQQTIVNGQKNLAALQLPHASEIGETLD